MKLCNASLALALLAVPAVLLTGCATDAASTAAATAPGTALTGRVFGGQQPVSGAAISLYAVGTTGLGSAPTSLLTFPVNTNASGAFSITADYTCPSATTQVYIVARGGNPGLTAGMTNPALVMMAPLGDCGNLSPSTFITINEVTTAASAWALAQFAPATASGAAFGATATNATGIRNAFLVANNLVNVATGLAVGASLPTAATLESAKLYTLADVLAVCINSNGGSACNPLFSAATQGFTPTNTLDAALNIVRNPGLNVAAVYNANNAQGPFQPTLTTVPNDWTMSITYTGGGLYAPTALGIDSTGSIWAANYFGGVASKLSASGIPASANGFADSNLYESYGLAIDTADNAWITVEETSGSVNSGDGSITKFSSTGTLLSGSGYTAGGIYYPYAIAADSNGQMWVADFGRSSATLLANDGTSASGTAGYTPTGLSFPTSVALDGSHNAFFGVQGSSVKVTPAGVGTIYTCCKSPAGVALDPAADVWIADYSASAIVELNPTGALTQTLTATGGIQYPESVTTDAGGRVWDTNYRGNTISGFTPSGASATPLSPSTGFGVDAKLSQPFGLAIDSAGNLWVSNFAVNTLTQFVGLATPTKTPRLGLPAKP